MRIWKTESIDQMNVSKLVTEKFGLAIPLAQLNPTPNCCRQTSWLAQKVCERIPVAYSIQRFLSTPLNNCKPAIEKMIITKTKM